MCITSHYRCCVYWSVRLCQTQSGGADWNRDSCSVAGRKRVRSLLVVAREWNTLLQSTVKYGSLTGNVPLLYTKADPWTALQPHCLFGAMDAVHTTVRTRYTTPHHLAGTGKATQQALHQPGMGFLGNKMA